MLPTAWLAWQLPWGRPWATTALTVTADTAGGLLGLLADSDPVTQVAALLAAAGMLAVRAGLPGRLLALARDPGSLTRPRAETDRWRRGATAERLTAELLAGLDRRYFVAHDLAVPGHSEANIDHVIVGPGGVLVVDTKSWRGRVTTDPEGRWRYGGKSMLEHGRSAAWEADELAGVLGVPVDVVLCPHTRLDLPAHYGKWGRVQVVSPNFLVDYLTTTGERLPPAEVERLAHRVRQTSVQAGDPHQRAVVRRASAREPRNARRS